MQAVIARMEDYREKQVILEERTLKTQELLNKSVGELAAIMKENNRIGEITNKSMAMGAVNEGKTIQNTIQSKIAGFKDFFTMRGFLDKTGMVQRGSGGIIDTALRKRQEKQEYISARKQVDPNMVNMKQFGGDQKKLDAYLGAKFEESQKLRLDLQKNQANLDNLKAMGFTDAQIGRTASAKTQGKLEAALAQADPRFRQNDLKIKEEKKVTKIQESSKAASGPLAKIVKNDSLTTNEEEKEQMSWRVEQIDILTDIRDSTGNMSDLLSDMFALDKKEALEKSKEEKPGGIFDSIKSMLGMGAAGGGSMLGAAARSTGRFMAGTGGKLLGAAALVGTAGYGLYSDWGDTNERLAAGEITQDEATVEKGTAIGKAGGTVAGGLAGAKLGAMTGAAIGSIIPGVGTAIGGVVGSIVGGIGGAFAGSKFGSMVGGAITNAGLAIRDFGKEYIVDPIINVGATIGNIFKEYIYDPLANAVSGIVGWFRSLKDGIVSWFTDFRIPGIGFEVFGREFGFGPWYPFRSDEAEAESGAPQSAQPPGGGAAAEPGTVEAVQQARAAATQATSAVQNFEMENGAPTKVVGYDMLGDAIMGYEDEEKNAQYQQLVRQKDAAVGASGRAQSQAVAAEGGVNLQDDNMSLENMSAKWNYLAQKGLDMSRFETTDRSNAMTMSDGKMYNPWLINAAYTKIATESVNARVDALPALAPPPESTTPMVPPVTPAATGDGRSAAAQAADPDGDMNADDPEAQVFASAPYADVSTPGTTNAGAVQTQSASVADAEKENANKPPSVVVQNNNNTSQNNQTIAPSFKPRNNESTVDAYYKNQFAG